MSKVIGKVAQIIGPVVDVVFNGKDVELPKIYDSLEITKKDGTLLVLEVQSHIGENTVRTISMDSTDGLSRGYEVVGTGYPIQMPIGADVYGRVFKCQFTAKLLNSKIYQLHLKFYSQVLK
jgi:F-type H+-transporting ATPase subunit beta